MTAFVRFGTTYRSACALPLATFALPAPVFFDPYMVDATGALFPLPVLLTDYRRDGVAVNQGAPGPQTQYVRRFFMADTVSGVPAGAAAGTPPSAVRVATAVTLTVEMEEHGNGRFHPPTIAVTYTELAYPSTQALDVAFEVRLAGGWGWGFGGRWWVGGCRRGLGVPAK